MGLGVKSLADRIAKATVEVSTQITQLQGETTHAVAAISSIGGTIHAASASSANLVEEVDGQVQASRSVVDQIRSTIESASLISHVLGTILDNASAARLGAVKVADGVNGVVTALDELNQHAGEFSRVMKVA